MSAAAAVVTKADARMWCRHFYQAVVKGVAEGVESAIMASTGGVLAIGADQVIAEATETATHLPADKLWAVALGAALTKGVLAAAQFLKANPGPTGDEVIEPGDKPT